MTPDASANTAGDAGAPMMENVTYDELSIGQSASSVHEIGTSDIALFAGLSGDVNPQHLDPDYAVQTQFGGVIAHGMLTAGYISALLGTTLPGPGTIYLEQSLRFRRPVRPGDQITATVSVTSLSDEKKRVVLDCTCTNQNGEAVVVGSAKVIAPSEKIRCPRPAVPTLPSC